MVLGEFKFGKSLDWLEACMRVSVGVCEWVSVHISVWMASLWDQSNWDFEPWQSGACTMNLASGKLVTCFLKLSMQHCMSGKERRAWRTIFIHSWHELYLTVFLPLLLSHLVWPVSRLLVTVHCHCPRSQFTSNKGLGRSCEKNYFTTYFIEAFGVPHVSADTRWLLTSHGVG